VIVALVVAIPLAWLVRELVRRDPAAGSAGSAGSAEVGLAAPSSARAPSPVRSATIPMPSLTAPRHRPDSTLQTDLADPLPQVRATAIKDYAKDPEADPAVFVEAMRDRDLGVAIVATGALGKQYGTGRYDGAALLASANDRTLPTKVRVAAMDGIGVVATPDAARLLVQLLASADLTDRRSAAILLQHQDPQVAVPALIDALADPDEVVVANAHDSLRALSRGRDFGNDAAGWRAWWASRR
jgi:hypothetical protein